MILEQMIAKGIAITVKKIQQKKDEENGGDAHTGCRSNSYPLVLFNAANGMYLEGLLEIFFLCIIVWILLS